MAAGNVRSKSFFGITQITILNVCGDGRKSGIFEHRDDLNLQVIYDDPDCFKVEFVGNELIITAKNPDCGIFLKIFAPPGTIFKPVRLKDFAWLDYPDNLVIKEEGIPNA